MEEQKPRTKMQILSDALKDIYGTDDKASFFVLGKIGTSSYNGAYPEYGYIHDEVLLETNQCLCTHPIVHQFVIMLKGRSDLPRSVVGSCCIKQFGIEAKRLCIVCGAAHRRHGAKCFTCHEKEQQRAKEERAKGKQRSKEERAEAIRIIRQASLLHQGQEKTFGSGCHTGRTFYDVANDDPDYIMDVKVTSPSLKAYKRWRKAVHTFFLST